MNPNFELARKVRELNGKVSQRRAAELLNVTQSCISSTCAAHNIEWIRQYRDQDGPNNHCYIDGLSRASVARITKRVLKETGRDLFVCERCGYKRDIPQPRHHKDRDRSNNAANNLEVLCVACHNREHMSERTRADDGQLLPKI